MPLVARPDQHVPTSAHVCAHKAAIHSGSSTKSRPFLLFDFEGEDGRVPKNLLVPRMTDKMSEGALRQQLEEATARRQEVIRERLPPLAYLLSDPWGRNEP